MHAHETATPEEPAGGVDEDGGGEGHHLARRNRERTDRRAIHD
jgi:hypothetical protein